MAGAEGQTVEPEFNWVTLPDDDIEEELAFYKRYKAYGRYCGIEVLKIDEYEQLLAAQEAQEST